MINSPTALLQPGDHKADKNRTPTAAGDKVWAGVAESFGLGAEPRTWTGSPSGCGRVFRQHYCTRRGGYARTRDPRQKVQNSSRTNPGLRLVNSNPYSIKCCHTNWNCLIKGPAIDRGPSKLKVTQFITSNLLRF